METGHVARKVSYVFLCALPVLAIPLVGIRALRVAGVHQSLGAVTFAAIVVAAWVLGARMIGSGDDRERNLALAGVLLITPFALIALFWVGLGPPWMATLTENRMRYLVILADSIAVMGGFVVLKELLGGVGERFYSTLGITANNLAGAAYLFWASFEIGFYVVGVRDGQLSPTIKALSDIVDILLFVACVLTYSTTLAFAASLGKVRWLGRHATRAYVVVAFVALVFIAMRGLSFPDPTSGSSAWYMQPGFVAGIPAVPWIMPFLLGVILLRRAGDERAAARPT
jgi:hypothetical protein